MTTDLFNPQTATNAAEFDPVAEAMAKANLSGGGRDKYLPIGKGVYSYEKIAWGVSPKNGALRMTIALRCESHELDAKHVGKVFEHKINYVGTGQRTLSMVLADYTKWLILPFGANAKAALQNEGTAVGPLKALIVKAYKEQFKTIVETQSLVPGNEGYAYKGKRVALDVVEHEYEVTDQRTGQKAKKKGSNTYIDVAA